MQRKGKNNQNINAKIRRKKINSPWVASQAVPLFIVVGSTQGFKSGIGAYKTEGKGLSLETGNVI